MGYEITVFLRGIKEIEKIIKKNPFNKIKKDEIIYATFLPSEFKAPKLPIKSPNNDIEVLEIKKGIAFSVSRKVKGRYGFPNGFIEKKLNIMATTRNWNTINKIIKY